MSLLVTALMVLAGATAVVGGLMAAGVLTFAERPPSPTPLAQPTIPATPAGEPSPEPTPEVTPSPSPSPPPAPTEPPTPVAQPSPGGTYVVQAGDTLEAISLRFGVSIQAIVEANNLVDANVIYVGQELVIPVPGEEPTDSDYYIVQPGDTLDEIAYKLDVPTALLAEVNNIENWDQIYVGQRLLIPGRQPAESPSPSPES
jgi:LysM repeat protein